MTDKTAMRKETDASALNMGFDDAFAAMQIELRGRLSNAPPPVHKLTRRLARTPGKTIRAACVLACAMREDEMICPSAPRAAAAVELLHLATLVHDDIIDSAPTRRGAPTLHTLYGERAAVLCGDYLLCMALELAAAMRPDETRQQLVDRSATRYLSDICLGEIRQNQHIRDYALSEREYFRIIKGKTAALFEFSFYAGFLLSDAPAEQKKNYLALGQNVGVMFQLADDAADYKATKTAAKKPVMSDYAQGVVTLPLIVALREDAALRGRIEAGMPEAELKKAVAETGGLDYTAEQVRLHYQKAQKLVGGLSLCPEKTIRLQAFVDKASGLWG